MSVKNIKTVILLMFENHSFDAMLGHLSFEGLQPKVDGIKPPLDQDQYANLYMGGIYHPFQRPQDKQLQSDLPHEYNYVATQLAPGPAGQLTMSGFVEAYADLSTADPAIGADPGIQPDPMGFYPGIQVPVTSFLARNYCIGDRWFCPLPSSTQPNRTIAFCGQSAIYETKLQVIPDTGNIFSWLDSNKISWGVYHDGFPFFALYPGLWDKVLGDNFHDYEKLATQLKNGTQPQVIIVEPSYQDGPHIGPDHPNDNHPPLAVGWGEDFLRRTYQAATMNPAVWAQTLMVVYYDEHGGFYDHVPPPSFDNKSAGNAAPPAPYAFNTLGPRIPNILISPWVSPGTVSHDLYDHTSVLQLLAEIFTPGKQYSDAVANRAAQGIKSLSTALTDTSSSIPPPPPPAAPIFATTLLGDNIAKPPDSNMGRALEAAALDMIQQRPDKVDAKLPLLNNWKAAIDQARPK